MIRVATTDPADARPAASTFAAPTNCYTERYVCGKGPTDYVYCTVDVCMTVGPVTVGP